MKIFRQTIFLWVEWLIICLSDHDVTTEGILLESTISGFDPSKRRNQVQAPTFGLKFPFGLLPLPTFFRLPVFFFSLLFFPILYLFYA